TLRASDVDAARITSRASEDVEDGRRGLSLDQRLPQNRAGSAMSSTDRTDIIALAAKAKARGVDDPAKVVIALEAIISGNDNYLAYRRRRSAITAYVDQTARDNEDLAMAIVIIESLSGQ